MAAPPGERVPHLAPQKDFDEEKERHSEFWEDVLRPSRVEYNELIRKAIVALQSKRPIKQALALRLLREAKKLQEKSPVAYWYLGAYFFEKKEWQECVHMLSMVETIEPTFVPKKRVLLFGSVEYALGMCLAHAGEYEQGLRYFRKVLRTDKKKRGYAFMRIAEIYMALGRLGEAISVYKQAEPLFGQNAMVHLGLAIAYDRNEQGSESQASLKKALVSFPAVRSFRNYKWNVFPAGDKFYYMALGLAARRDFEPWSILFWRHYLAITKSGPWRERARWHLKNLESRYRPSRHITWPRIMDRNRLSTLAAKTDRPLARCMENVPHLLLSAEIRPVWKSGKDIRISSLYSVAPVSKEIQKEVQGCVKGVLQEHLVRAERSALRRAMVRHSGPNFPIHMLILGRQSGHFAAPSQN